MGKTPSPGKWIKSLLGKKSSRSSLDKGSEKLKSAKKEELVVKVKEKDNNVSSLLAIPQVISSQEVVATQTVTVPDDVVITEKQPSGSDESNVNHELEEHKLEEAATKLQAAFRAHQVRGEFQTLKGVIKLQAVIRGHLVRRQAVATYSCIWGVVKLQALVRGRKARSSETGVQLQISNMEEKNSETLEGITYSWMVNPTKLSMIDKLLVSSSTTLPLKIQYGPEDPNSAKVWLERWTHLQVWAPGPVVVKSLIPKAQTKKRSFQAVETEKGKFKRGIKKPSGGSNSGNSRSTAENEKPKRTVRKASTLGKEPSRIENDKSKQKSRKSTSAIKEASSLEVKDEKPRISLKKANGIEKGTRKSAEKKKEIADSVQKESPVDKISPSVVETPEEELKTAESIGKAEEEIQEPNSETSESIDKAEEEIQEPNIETSESIDKAEEEIQEPDIKTTESIDKAEEEIQEPDIKTTDSIDKAEEEIQEPNIKTAESIDKAEEEIKTTESIDKAEEEIQDPSSGNENVASENTKPNDRRASLPAKIENNPQDDGLTHSGRKIPSYMAPTASAKARVRGQGSPRIAQEKPEKNGTTTRRHSLPPGANGKLNTMSPRAHRLLIASAKGSMNSDRSFSSSKDIGDKSTKAEWKR